MADLIHCKSCDRDLPADEFHRDGKRASGRAFYCRGCKRVRAAASYERCSACNVLVGQIEKKGGAENVLNALRYLERFRA